MASSQGYNPSTCDGEGPSSGIAVTPDQPSKSVHFSSSRSDANVGGADSEAKTLSKETNSDSRSVNIMNRTVETTTKTNIKGTCAKFLRQNPRFINEPICRVLPNEYSTSVGECLSWQAASTNSTSNTPASIDGSASDVKSLSNGKPDKFCSSTCHSSYLPPTSDQRPHPLKKHNPSPKVNGIAPLINEGHQVEVRERISYAHQYNSRTDPNEPIRGKLHGSFVWEHQKTTTNMPLEAMQPSKQ